MRRKNLTVFICLLATLALASIGFAAWVITNDANAGDTGSITVDIVKDARIDMSAEILNDDAIVFGSKSTIDAPYKWLKYEQTKDGSGTVLDLDENLSITVRITVSNYSYLTSTNAVTLTFTEKEGESYYSNALGKGYVGALPVITLDRADLIDSSKVSNITHDQDNDKVTFEIEVKFAWGTAFNGKNPIDFYNSSEYSDVLADEAFDTLEDLNITLNNGKINYILTVEAKTEN